MSSENQKDESEMQPGDELETPDSGVDDIAERLAEAERETEQFKRLAQRAQADLVNYRNRVKNEQEVMQARTVQRVVTRFIEIADQLEKALEPAVSSGVESQWVTGVEAIYQNLLHVVKAEGFDRFDAHGEEFDPRRHDALLTSPSDQHPPNSVMNQLAAGYTRNGEVVRPAQVVIAESPTEENPGSTEVT
jgi:molecular chaperone GrpE